MKKELKYDPEHAQEQFMAAIIGLSEALKLTVDELAALKDPSDTSWFDNLKQQAVQIAKGTVTESIPIETDASAVRFAFETVDAAFERLRSRIIKKE
ncbi:hypothetical protein [Brucella anthropi]